MHARAGSSRRALVTASEETAETLRIEAGRPRFGIDMNTDTIPLEAGIEDRAISFTKGCYVGQEVIIRVMHRGHGRVARRLVSIVLPDGTVPARGDKIHVGRTQSSARSPARPRRPKLGAASGAGLRAARPRRGLAPTLTVDGSQARVYQPVELAPHRPAETRAREIRRA